MEERKEILSKLYTLRAGLSMLSEEYDKRMENRFVRYKTVLVKTKEFCEKISRDTGYTYCHSQEWNANMPYPSYCGNESASVYAKEALGDEETVKNFSEYCIYHQLWNSYENTENISGEYLQFYLIAFLNHHTLHDWQNEVSQMLESCGKPGIFSAKKKRDFYEFYNRELAWLNVAERRKPEFKPYLEKALKPLEEKGKQIEVHAEALFADLKNQFEDLLDVRDWQYLDLIIYYFETRRAESMREALQLADRERQTQEIIANIRAAAALICQTIKDGFYSLQQTMIAGFTALNQTLQSGLSQLNATSQAQLAQEELTNSLLRKANLSSEKLVEDVKALRSISRKFT